MSLAVIRTPAATPRVAAYLGQLAYTLAEARRARRNPRAGNGAIYGAIRAAIEARELVASAQPVAIAPGQVYRSADLRHMLEITRDGHRPGLWRVVTYSMVRNPGGIGCHRRYSMGYHTDNSLADWLTKHNATLLA